MGSGARRLGLYAGTQTWRASSGRYRALGYLGLKDGPT